MREGILLFLLEDLGAQTGWGAWRGGFGDMVHRAEGQGEPAEIAQGFGDA